MSHIANDLWYEARNQWLEENGREWRDVMHDDRGEYVLAEGEERMEKVYLPDNLQQQ